MPKAKVDTKSEANLNDQLNQLQAIADWFDTQDQVDVEAGLKKVKEAVGLIRSSQERLRDLENEFTEIKKELDLDAE